ncbi:MAG: DNA-3-methyladenine glycosylase [Candidatus Baltobacteraceae bacterium]
MSFSKDLCAATPFRLDLTADALRRLATNVVDTVDEEGVYRRILSDAGGANAIEVKQAAPDTVRVTIAGEDPQRWLPVVERMLGLNVLLDEWRLRTEPFPWLASLAHELRGLKPPRYPSVWEALAHAIVFQQISIHAAASIMRRVVEQLAPPMAVAAGTLHPFPPPQALLAASDDVLRSAGLSANKVAHLRSAATAVLDGVVSQARIETLDTAQALESLTRIRGIGPWSAAVVLLRGFARLGVFPLNDSGVARSIRLLSGNHDLDVNALLEALGPMRGMLYFHLLLGRMRNLTPP